MIKQKVFRNYFINTSTLESGIRSSRIFHPTGKVVRNLGGGIKERCFQSDSKKASGLAMLAKSLCICLSTSNSYILSFFVIML